MTADRRLIAKFGDQFFLGIVWRMDRIVRQVQKERFFAVSLDEVDRVIGEKVGQILTLGIFSAGVGSKVEVLAGQFDCFVEAALAWVMLRVGSQVPLAEHAGG